MFPAITQALKEWREGFGSEPIALGLKHSDFTFTPTNIADLETAKRDRVRAALGGYGPAWSGEVVTESTALNNGTVWACTRIIAETSASLPLFLMRKTRDGRFPATDKPLYGVLHDEPNEEMSDMEWRESTTARCVLRGDGYGRIIRRPATDECVGVYPLMSANPDRDKKNRLIYEVPKGNGVDNETFTVEPNKPHDIFHLRGLGFDGIRGQSVITLARQSIGSALSAEKYAAKFYASGGRQPGYLKLANKVFKNDQEQDQFRADMERFLANSENYHRIPMFPPNVEFSSYGWSPEDSQFLETRQFTIPEICRWFRISPHLVGDLSRATFSNIEHLAIEFVQQTLMAWLVRWEKAVYRCLLTPQEKAQGLYAKHNVSALLRGDFQSRMQGYATLLQNGVANIDTIRELEDWNPLPNDAGKSHHIQLNMQTVPGTGEPTAAELAAIAKYQAAQNGGGDSNAA